MITFQCTVETWLYTNLFYFSIIHFSAPEGKNIQFERFACSIIHVLWHHDSLGALSIPVMGGNPTSFGILHRSKAGDSI